MSSVGQKLLIAANALTWRIDLSSLPVELNELDVSENKYTGRIDLCNLPDEMEHLDVSTNNFTDTSNLVNLPISFIVVSTNLFSIFDSFNKQFHYRLLGKGVCVDFLRKMDRTSIVKESLGSLSECWK
jgi:Leucine-rich repeat (LRR) protein